MHTKNTIKQISSLIALCYGIIFVSEFSLEFQLGTIALSICTKQTVINPFNSTAFIQYSQLSVFLFSQWQQKKKLHANANSFFGRMFELIPVIK